MKTNDFPGWTRTASRRTSILAFGGAGLGAAVTGVFSATAKSKTGKRSKKAKKRCKAQVAPCRAALESTCVPGSDFDFCIKDSADCCAPLANCNAQAAMECVVTQFIL